MLFNFSWKNGKSKTCFFQFKNLDILLSYPTNNITPTFLAITNLKYNNYTNFYKFLSLLSWHVSLNPGPIQKSPDTSSTIGEPLNKVLQFLHININSLFLKKDKIRSIASKTKAGIIGKAETKLDHTVPDSEVNFPEYDILQCDKNRNGGGVTCYIRKDLCFNTRTLHCQEIENVGFDILLPKSNPITVFYRPPNQAEFMDLVIKKIFWFKSKR